jgi:hypothetical protein
MANRQLHHLILIFATLVAFSGRSEVAFAQGVPELLPFQGRLADPSTGVPISTTSTVNFRVYPPSGTCYVYEDTQTVSPNVYGVFAVMLGASGNSTGPANQFVTAFGNAPVPMPDSCGATYTPGANDSRRIEVVVDGTPMPQMQTVGASAYSLTAQNAVTLNGLLANQFLQTSTDLTQVNAETLVNGSDASLLHNHDSIYVRRDGSNGFTGGIYTTNGSIGVGTINPVSNIEVDEVSPTIRLTSQSGGGGTPEMDFYSGTTERAAIKGSDTTNQLTFYTGSTQALMLDASQNAYFAGSAVIAGTMSMGRYTTVQEAAVIAALTAQGASAVGTMWVNIGPPNTIRYWDGTAAQSLALESDVVYTLTAGNGIANVGSPQNPVLSLTTTGVAANTYRSVTVDVNGRVTAGTNPTTVSGYGLTDAVQNVGGLPTVGAGTDAAKGAAGSTGKIYVATDAMKIYRDNGTSWDIVGASSFGDISGINTILKGGTGVATVPTNGQLLIGNGTGYTVGNLSAGSGVSITNSAGGIQISASGTGGTVTSVSSANSDISVTNGTSTPVLTLNSGTGPNQVVELNSSSQLPAVDGSLLTNIGVGQIGGTLPIANGGTNSNTALNNNRMMASSGGAIVEMPAMTNGQVIVGSTAGAPTVATLGASNGIVTTPGAGTLSISTNATTTKTASALVIRDGTGSFAAGDITMDGAVLKGATSGQVTLTAPSSFTSYSLAWPVSAGNAGQLLTSDGAGNLSWNNPAVVPTATYTSQGLVQIDTNAATSGLQLTSGVLDLATSGVTANTYGSATTVPQITVDSFGRVTSANSVTITGVSPVGSSLADGQIWVGNSSGTAAAVTPSTDVTMDDTGSFVVKLTGNNSAKLLGANPGANHVIVTDGTTGATLTSAAVSADTFTQYALLNGRAGGQTLEGGNAASNNITIDSTSNATKGYVLLAPTSGNVGIGTTVPATKMQVAGTIKVANGGETCTVAADGGMIRFSGVNLQYCDGTTWQTLGISGAGITGLTGDVTATGSGSVAATISAGAIVDSKVAAGAAIARSKLASGTNNAVLINDSSGVMSSEAQLAPVRGGTGFDGSTAANGKIPVGNGAGFSLANITGTANQVTVTNGAGTIGLSLPQNIDSTASPTFAGQTLTAGTMTSDVANGAAAKAFTLNTSSPYTTTAKLFSLENNGTEAFAVAQDGSVLIGGTTVLNSSGTYSGGIVPPAKGGTGINGGSAGNGTLAIGNGSGYSLANITGTANQVTVTNGSGTIGLSLPQNIDSTATPTFGGATLTAGNLNSGVANGAAAKAFTLNTPGAYSSTAKLLSLENNGTENFAVVQDGSILTTSGLQTSSVANGAAAKAFTLNTSSGYTTTAKLLSIENNGTEAFAVAQDGSVLIGGTTVLSSSGTYSGGIVPATKGGTGFNGGAAANGSIPIGNGSGFALANITGTANQVTVTNGAGTIGLSLPQNIDSTASPTFAGETLTAGTVTSSVANGAAAKAFTLNTSGAYSSTAKLFSLENNGTENFAVVQDGSILTTSGVQTSSVANGAAAKAFTLNTSGAYSGTAKLFSLENNGTESFAVAQDGSVLIDGVTVMNSSGAWTGGIIPATKGGTGINGGAAANGTLAIGNGSGYSLANITGTTNQVTVTNGSGTIGLSLPQNIDATASPTFAGETLTAGTMTSSVANGAAAKAFTLNTSGAYTTTAKLLSLENNGTEAFAVAQDGSVLIGGTTVLSSGGTYSGGIVPATKGGTGFNGGAAANGSIPIGNGSGFALANITGTTNQVTVTNGSGTIGLSLPQNIDSTASPTFAGETLTAGTMTSSVANGAAAKAFTLNTSGAYSTTAKLFSLENNGTENFAVVQDGSVMVDGVTVVNSSGAWSGGVITPAKGGTGINGSAAANGTLAIGNGSGYSLANITGTTNQVTVTNGAGTIGLSLPQNIDSTASPTFAGETLTAGTVTSSVANGAAAKAFTLNTSGAYSSTAKLFSLENNGTENFAVVQDGSILTTSGLQTSSVANSGTAKAFTLNTSNPYTTTAKLLSIENNGTEAFAVAQDGSVLIGGTTVLSSSGTYSGGIVPATKGGTGINAGSAANGTIPIGNGSGFALANITGTTNQVNVTNGAGTIGLSLPQNIDATASPTFAGATLTAGTVTSSVANGAAAKAFTLNTSGAYSTTAKLFSLENNGTENFAVVQDGSILTTSGVQTSSVANGAAAKAFTLNTSGAYTGTAKLFSLENNGTENFAVAQDGSVLIGGTTVMSSAGAWSGGVITPAKGGTGINGSAAANGTLAIGNGSGYSLANITGTTNQVTVTNGSGTIGLSLPQNIDATASPTFAGETLTGGVMTSTVANGAAAKAFTLNTSGAYSTTAKLFSLENNGTENFSVVQDGSILTTSGLQTSSVANSATAKAFTLNTSSAYSTTAKLLSLENNGTEAFAVAQDGSILIGGTTVLSSSGTYSGGIVPATKGGTGLNGGSAGNGTLPIGNGSGFSLANITGTTNQVTVTNGAGTIGLSLPQNIDSTASPTFAGENWTGGVLTSSVASGAAAKAFTFNTSTGYSSTAKLMSVQNNGSEKMAVVQDGSMTATALTTTGGSIASTDTNITGPTAAINFGTSNVQVLQSASGAALTLSGMVSGGAYTLIVADTTSRTYTFGGQCAATSFVPANAATQSGKKSIYTLIFTSNVGGGTCFISWVSGL